MNDGKHGRINTVLVLRPALWPVYIAAGPSMAISLVASLGALTNPALWTPAGIFFFFAMICLYPMGYRLEVRQGILEYQWGLWTLKTVHLEHLVSAEIEVGERRWRDRFRPWIRLVLRADNPSIIQSIDIPIMVFRRAQATRLVRVLKQLSDSRYTSGPCDRE